jgi:hypothetical protein
LWWLKYSSRMAYLAVSADLDSWWRSKRGREIWNFICGGNYRTLAPKRILPKDGNYHTSAPKVLRTEGILRKIPNMKHLLPTVNQNANGTVWKLASRASQWVPMLRGFDKLLEFSSF